MRTNRKPQPDKRGTEKEQEEWRKGCIEKQIKSRLESSGLLIDVRG